MTDHEDLLLSRVADGCDAGADWDELDRLAARDPDVWCRLADTLRSTAKLRDAVLAPLSVADDVELPAVPGRAGRAPWARTWRSWAAACLLVSAVLVGFVAGRAAPSGGDAEPDPLLTPEEHMAAYMQAGHAAGSVIGQLPDVVVKQTPSPDGVGVEVVIVRRVVERRRVNRAYSLTHDEHGRLRARAVPIKTNRRTETF